MSPFNKIDLPEQHMIDCQGLPVNVKWFLYSLYFSPISFIVLFCLILLSVKKPFQREWHLKASVETYALTPSRPGKFLYSPPYKYLCGTTHPLRKVSEVLIYWQSGRPHPHYWSKGNAYSHCCFCFISPPSCSNLHQFLSTKNTLGPVERNCCFFAEVPLGPSPFFTLNAAAFP